MSKTRKITKKRRDELRHHYGITYQKLNDLLYKEDPVGINTLENTDEYNLEVSTILPRLRNCESVDDVRQVVHEEFVNWFDADTAGSLEKYQVVAKHIWEEILPEMPK